MINPASYKIAVQQRQTEDGIQFEGTAKELPDLSVYADTFEEAYELVCDALETLYELSQEQGAEFPSPAVTEQEFSGKFVVRVPKWLHRRLSEAAADNCSSLNQYVVSILSGYQDQQIFQNGLIVGSVLPSTQSKDRVIFDLSVPPDTLVSSAGTLNLDRSEAFGGRPIDTAPKNRSWGQGPESEFDSALLSIVQN